MKIALFNVTNLVDNNPGCRATISGLKKAIGEDIVYQFPMGMGYHYFQQKENLFFKKTDTFNNAYLKLKKNKDYERFIVTSDVIIINSEGTIHSNSIGAKTLLAFAKLSKEYRKKVFLVNGSYFNLNEELIDIIRSCDKVYVREIKSYDYLLKSNVKSFLVPDCAFLTEFKFASIKHNKCLYTPGVVFSYGEKKEDVDVNSILFSHYEIIRKKYRTPVFLLIEEKERVLANKWIEYGGDVIDSTKLSINNLLTRISEFENMISGRYHILLFALMCQVRTVPLSSNTFKILGLYETFSTDIDIFLQDSLNPKIDINQTLLLDVDLDAIRERILLSYKELFN